MGLIVISSISVLIFCGIAVLNFFFTLPVNISATVSPGLWASCPVLIVSIYKYYIASKSNNAVFGLANKAISVANEEIKKIRREQNITLDFRIDLIKKRVFVTSTHVFYYENEDAEEITISSDFRGFEPDESSLYEKWKPRASSRTLNEDFIKDITSDKLRFHFKKIDNGAIAGKVLEWDKSLEKVTDGEINCMDIEIQDALVDLHRMTRVKKNKLYYRSKAKLTKEKTRFEFVIHRKYGLDDRLVWSIQELSDAGLEITIKFDENLMQEKNKFFFVLNHPLANKILKSPNNEYRIDEYGRLLGNDKDTPNKTTLAINQIILPYQSFEISWAIIKVV